jgi:hypothetical protein
LDKADRSCECKSVPARAPADDDDETLTGSAAGGWRWTLACVPASVVVCKLWWLYSDSIPKSTMMPRPSVNAPRFFI